MPAVLETSQFDTLEPLAPDEHGIALDVSSTVQAIVESFVAYLHEERG